MPNDPHQISQPDDQIAASSVAQNVALENARSSRAFDSPLAGKVNAANVAAMEEEISKLKQDLKQHKAGSVAAQAEISRLKEELERQRISHSDEYPLIGAGATQEELTELRRDLENKIASLTRSMEMQHIGVCATAIRLGQTMERERTSLINATNNTSSHRRHHSPSSIVTFPHNDDSDDAVCNTTVEPLLTAVQCMEAYRQGNALENQRSALHNWPQCYRSTSAMGHRTSTRHHYRSATPYARIAPTEQQPLMSIAPARPHTSRVAPIGAQPHGAPAIAVTQATIRRAATQRPRMSMNTPRVATMSRMIPQAQSNFCGGGCESPQPVNRRWRPRRQH